MCAKPEPQSYLQPIAELIDELVEYDHHNPLRDLPWVGITAFYGVLENV